MKNNDITFENIEEFSIYVLKEMEKDNELFVSIIGKFDEIKATLMDVMLHEDINFESLHIESPDSNGYNDEYILSLWVNDCTLEVGCEPLKKDGKYLNPCGDIAYLFGNCSSKIILLCEGSELYFVNFESEYDCDEECECACGCHKESKEFSTTSSYAINGKSASKEEFGKKYTELQKKHEKNMRSILDGYCDFMDEFNTLFARLW